LCISFKIDKYRLAADYSTNVTDIYTRCFARIGLLGNPSDGYSGKTLSSTIENFSATVRLRSSKRVAFIPSPIGDTTVFDSPASFVSSIRKNGYDGGLKLLMATTKTFWDVLKEEKILVSNPAKGFEMSYETDVPRQSGLAGSSAICTAAFRSLQRWYGVPELFIPPERLAGYILSVEQKELGIAAGLQDRVAQAFDRPVFMDFTPAAFAANHNRCGNYRILPEDAVAFFHGHLFLLFKKSTLNEDEDEGKSSGKIHSPVRKRWEEGDEIVRATMVEIGELATKGVQSIANKDPVEFIKLMNQNFALRMKLFGNAVSVNDRELIAEARRFGDDVGAKLPGSGGTVLVFAMRGMEFEKAMKRNTNIDIIRVQLRGLERSVSNL
jgi:glucuronokinase